MTSTDLSKLKISLEKFEVFAFCSEESVCFNSEIHWDGAKVGIAENAGDGSKTKINPSELSDALARFCNDQTLVDYVDELVKRKLN